MKAMRVILYAIGGLMILSIVIAMCMDKFLLAPVKFISAKIARQRADKKLYQELKKKYNTKYHF